MQQGMNSRRGFGHGYNAAATSASGVEKIACCLLIDTANIVTLRTSIGFRRKMYRTICE